MSTSLQILDELNANLEQQENEVTGPFDVQAFIESVTVDVSDYEMSTDDIDVMLGLMSTAIDMLAPIAFSDIEYDDLTKPIIANTIATAGSLCGEYNDAGLLAMESGKSFADSAKGVLDRIIMKFEMLIKKLAGALRKKVGSNAKANKAIADAVTKSKKSIDESAQYVLSGQAKRGLITAGIIDTKSIEEAIDEYGTAIKASGTAEFMQTAILGILSNDSAKDEESINSLVSTTYEGVIENLISDFDLKKTSSNDNEERYASKTLPGAYNFLVVRDLKNRKISFSVVPDPDSLTKYKSEDKDFFLSGKEIRDLLIEAEAASTTSLKQLSELNKVIAGYESKVYKELKKKEGLGNNAVTIKLTKSIMDLTRGAIISANAQMSYSASLIRSVSHLEGSKKVD